MTRILEKDREQFEAVKRLNLSLDMSRGKPGPEQLDLSMGMLELLRTPDDVVTEGTDLRNYGGLDGLPAAKALFASILDVQPDEVIIGGNSSLTMMHDTLVRAMLFGVVGSEQPWGQLPVVKFLCPSPGYDRHFAITELLGMEMIPVEMTSEGPNMDQVEALIQEDESIKGIWCVPKYSNPDGITYSDQVVKRLAAMPAAARDFRIMWDNAYSVHHLTDQPDPLTSILAACREAGNPDRVYLFASTSKVTFPGSGLAAMAASKTNLSQIRKLLSIQTIGPDKLNQQRHSRFLPDTAALHSHMAKHAELIGPKFKLVLDKLEQQLGDTGYATWNRPNGGYFISVNVLDGCAKRVVAMAAEAGVTLTPAGATFPYGLDPRDRNIRLAPTYPSLEELEQAMDVFCLCVRVVCGSTQL